MILLPFVVNYRLSIDGFFAHCLLLTQFRRASLWRSDWWCLSL